MADTKISAMPSVMDVKVADVMPVVQFGANMKTRKDVFLTGGAGEDIGIISSGGQASRLGTNSTNAEIVAFDSGQTLMTGTVQVFLHTAFLGVANTLLLTTGGGITLVVDQTLQMRLEINGLGQVIFTGGSNDLSIVGFTTTSYQYVPGLPASWNGASPTTVEGALDRCSVLLKFLNGGVGP